MRREPTPNRRNEDSEAGGRRTPLALVTGASRGIGAGIARTLAEKGCDLVLCCEKNRERLEELAESLRSEFGTVICTCLGDVGDPGFAARLRREAEAFFAGESEAESTDRVAEKNGTGNAGRASTVSGRTTFDGFDVLVCNAGISHVGLLSDMTDEQWDRIVAVNLSSCFYLAREFAPDMVRRKSGNIIFISSMWGSRGASCEVAYSATKGGVEAFTKALAKELAPSHVVVNAISCGVIDTDMNAGFSEEERQDMREWIPADRFGTPEDVGRAVAALLTTSYLTGQIIGVDGGV